MIVAFDNTFLTLVLNPKALPRPDPMTGEPARHCSQRIEALIDEVSRRRGLVIVPAPAWAEALCAAPDLQKMIDAINRSTTMEVRPFDGLAAYELAEMTRKASANGDKRDGVTAGWQKVKFDRQIVAVAKAHGASILYTDDTDQAKFAGSIGLEVQHTWQLPLPAHYAQTDWIDDAERPTA